MTGDLLAHNIDTALWLNGPITEVTAMTETFIKERKHNLTGKVQPVGIDDASAFLCRFENGSLATFEATRYARGHKALYTLEINGEHASAFWDLHDLHRIQYFDHRDEGRVRGWRNVHVTDGDQPYMKHWWVPGPADRLRAHLHPSVRRLRGGGGEGQEPRRRPSATVWRPTTSPTRCSSRRSRGSGRRSVQRRRRPARADVAVDVTSAASGYGRTCGGLRCSQPMQFGRVVLAAAALVAAPFSAQHVIAGGAGTDGGQRLRRRLSAAPAERRTRAAARDAAAVPRGAAPLNFEDRTGFDQIFDGSA